MGLTLRMAVYTLAAVVASFGFGVYDAEAGTLTLSLDQIAIAIGASGVVNGLVVAVWGKK